MAPLSSECCCEVDIIDSWEHRDTKMQIGDHGHCSSRSFLFKALVMIQKSNWYKDRFRKTILRSHTCGEIMRALQLGIRHFAVPYMALPETDLSPLDFRSTKKTWIRYSKPNPKTLPPGAATDFEWKDYCPAVFRNLQELDSIDYAGYMLSVCGHETLRQISSPGKSGSLLFMSKDDRFVIKTLRKSEVKVLLEMLPNYYEHLKTHGTSLLIKFYGLHVVRPLGGLKGYFVVMENIFQSELCIHKRYDLKGSSQGRTVAKVEALESLVTYKDLDLDFCFYLNPMLRHRLLAQIKHDCDLLEAEGIMDYSLLIGMHIEPPHRASFKGKSLSIKKMAPQELLVREKSTQLTLSDICQHPDRPGFKLGVKVPARAVRVSKNEAGSVSLNQSVGGSEYFNVLLYFGIIDILQGYNARKKFEHAFKAIHYDSKSISAVNPKAYSSRFQDFLSQVFKAEDSNS